MRGVHLEVHLRAWGPPPARAHAARGLVPQWVLLSMELSIIRVAIATVKIIAATVTTTMIMGIIWHNRDRSTNNCFSYR